MSQPTPPPMPTEPPTTPRPTRKRTVATALTGALAGAAIVGAAWLATSTSDSGSTGSKSATATNASTVTGSASPGTFMLSGTFVLTEGAVDDGALGCEGTGGYDDIGMGTSVTVYDAAGTVIAASSLVMSDFDQAAGSCTFEVDVDNVPDGEAFYQVEISHRGKVQLSAEQAKAGAFSSSLG